MSSNAARIQGCQEPRIKLEPKPRDTDGYDACSLAADYGLVADEWQEDVLACWMGRDTKGKWTANECGLVVPRQNGKNAILEIRELFGAAVLGESILHTAHQVKTAREAFSRVCGFFDNEQQWPELAEMVREIRRTNGQEGIILNNGGCVRFVARSRSSARGFTADVLVLDEAQELTNEQIEALQPTLSAAPLKNQQVIMTGTPPGPTTPGEVLRTWREDAIAKRGKRKCWHEWSVDSIGDTSDKARWYATNPALGTRISLAAVESEYQTLSEDGFARERLGWWSKNIVARVLDEEEWNACKTDKPPKEGKLAYAVKFSPDGSSVSLAVAMRPSNGKPHIEVIAHKQGNDRYRWLVQWLYERWKNSSAIVIDGLSRAPDLAERLRQEGVSNKVIWLPRASDVIKSSSMMLQAIREGRITHYSQPVLNDSALKACKRTIGTNGGWGFGSGADSDSTPIEACSLAYWAAMTSKRQPQRKLRVG